jgi:hypothetical protein
MSFTSWKAMYVKQSAITYSFKVISESETNLCILLPAQR